ncbi:hypothetical protein V1969_32520, partial [Pseudomonas aeruginosa]
MTDLEPAGESNRRAWDAPAARHLRGSGAATQVTVGG